MIQSRKFTQVVMATMNRKELSKIMKQTATRICRLSGEKLPRKCRIRRKRVNSNGLRPNTRQDRQPRVIAPLLPLRLAIDSNSSMLWESTKHQLFDQRKAMVSRLSSITKISTSRSEHMLVQSSPRKSPQNQRMFAATKRNIPVSMKISTRGIDAKSCNQTKISTLRRS